MAIKPILFNTAMVRAIREDEKTQTRRVIPPEEVTAVLTSPCRLGNPDIPDSRFVQFLCSTKYEKGDVLWVRENWAVAADLPGVSEAGFVYMADYSTFETVELKRKHFRWRPSIHMPKEVAREFLLVTDVWAEQLQCIDAAGIRAEGIRGGCFENDPEGRGTFRRLWNSTCSKDKLSTCGWEADPWVSVIAFQRCSRPEGF